MEDIQTAAGRRLVVLPEPTEAQLNMIPLGSDAMVVMGDASSGPWHKSIRDEIIEAMHTQEAERMAGHLVVFVPPEQTAETVTTASDILKEARGLFLDDMRSKREDSLYEDDFDTLFNQAVSYAISRSREGMTFLPF